MTTTNRKKRTKTKLRYLYKVLAVLLVGFAGGCIAPWFVGWMRPVHINNASNAISIANTYVVFTTIIFVGTTVVLAVASYVFTQHFYESKHNQETALIKELKTRIGEEESLAIELADNILDNPDVQQHIEDRLNEKFQDLVAEKQADSRWLTDELEEENGDIQAMASQVTENGRRSND